MGEKKAKALLTGSAKLAITRNSPSNRPEGEAITCMVLCRCWRLTLKSGDAVHPPDWFHRVAETVTRRFSISRKTCAIVTADP